MKGYGGICVSFIPEGTMMQVTIDIPEKLAEHLQAQWRDISRHLLERLVLEAYRDDILTTREVQDILGLEARLAVYDLCDKHNIATYTLADVQRDRETTQRLGF
jgi:hypothetical protein